MFAAFYMFAPHSEWVVTVIVIIFILLVATAGQNRRHITRTSQRICRGCAVPNPPYAHFCRRCGKSLE